jgi:hypothetical protein
MPRTNNKATLDAAVKEQDEFKLCSKAADCAKCTSTCLMESIVANGTKVPMIPALVIVEAEDAVLMEFGEQEHLQNSF